MSIEGKCVIKSSRCNRQCWLIESKKHKSVFHGQFVPPEDVQVIKAVNTANSNCKLKSTNTRFMPLVDAIHVG